MAPPSSVTLHLGDGLWFSSLCSPWPRPASRRVCVPEGPPLSQVLLLREGGDGSLPSRGPLGFLTPSGPPPTPHPRPAPPAARHISTCLTLRGCGMGRLSSLSAAISMKKGFRIRICLGLTSQMRGGCFQKPFRT